VAFAIFAVAMITDKIDGDLARKLGLVTDFGKIADPIAVKAITGMAFIGLSIVGDIWWFVTIVVLLREWGVTLLRLTLLKKVVIAAADLGKLKTTFQAIALGTLCLPLRDPELASWMEVPGEVLFYAAQACLAVAVALTLWSGWEFYRDVWKQRATLRGLLSDRPPKAIAYDLGISDKTLYRHRANLMEKLGARSNADLARIPRERGLLADLG